MTKTAVADPEEPKKPAKPCLNCGTNDWWLCEGWGKKEWRCGKCHPKPRGLEIKEEGI